MSPSQGSSDNFPRLTGSRYFDVWKTRVTASLDDKHLLGFVTKKDYDGVSDDDEDEEASSDGSNMSDGEDPTKHSTPVNYDSQAVDYEPSSDEDASGSEEDAKTSTTSKPPSPVRSFSQRTLQRRADQ
ncbi:unnamed protein product [Phytophthora fragariaefolia]|uniref:Unnamed protein product n=1 Tax=Phytophthora fragariaefolia TaxID=1490495 RepID=A0A9W6YE76_9STRA|nr:unnamed protein product [Phytophthora fragariaefolia]